MSEPQTASQTIHVTRQMLVRYAGASGDFNPIHFSDHYATALGQESVIGHGMLTMGLAMRLVTDFAGDVAKVRSCQFRFKRPVPVPDDADGTAVTFELTTAEPDGADPAGPDQTIACTLSATVDGTVVGTGKAEVIR